ncbi:MULTISPECIES: hypothetical protein [unclassified Thermosynechococcus]|uniref:hypothetical protein n=1 Tax=unclassified Thermosynechococcus TaxID=2622553 RepID=UPI0019DA4F95|nr:MULTISPECIES: hypothetical protein [unclassified Thermosynechococcus]HIK34892.1 hypothetical protein [Thermosynechococcus sp. M98_K2018_005]HIK49189.1 hypothetical protein [Thermosynechococcus sp. M55_K2018_012]
MLNDSLKGLKVKRDEITQQLAAPKEAGNDAWESLKAGFQGAWDELSKAFEEAASKFQGE